MIGGLPAALPVYTPPPVQQPAPRAQPVPRVQPAPRAQPARAQPASRSQFSTPRRFVQLKKGVLVVQEDKEVKWLAITVVDGVAKSGVDVQYLQPLPGESQGSSRKFRKIWQSVNPEHVEGKNNSPKYRFTLSNDTPTQCDSNPWTPYTGRINKLSDIKLCGLTLEGDGSLAPASYKAFDILGGSIGAVSTVALRLL